MLVYQRVISWKKISSSHEYTPQNFGTFYAANAEAAQATQRAKEEQIAKLEVWDLRGKPRLDDLK